MKRSVFFLLINVALVMFIVLSAAGSPKHSGLPGNEAFLSGDLTQKKDTVSQKVVYTCTMHPEVIQDTPGKCPKCKMNLVRKEIAKGAYTCPMHPEVIQNTPGKCTRCKMNLVKKEIVKK